MEGLSFYIKNLLDDIQLNMVEKARAYRDAHITKADTWEEFKKVLERKRRIYFRSLGWHR